VIRTGSDADRKNGPAARSFAVDAPPTIRFPERAQWGQGTETLAELGALPPSGACVWQRLDA